MIFAFAFSGSHWRGLPGRRFVLVGGFLGFFWGFGLRGGLRVVGVGDFALTVFSPAVGLRRTGRTIRPCAASKLGTMCQRLEDVR